MENKLEQLLNSLIEKGWKPRGEDKIHTCRYYDEEKKFKADYTIAGIPQVLYRSIRELCSREAGLWQFVCENGMIGRGDRIIKKKKVKDTDSRSGEEVIYYSVIGSYNETDYEYRVIESSLKDESELEDFILDNVKIGNI